MRIAIMGASALMLTVCAANAGNLDRTGQSVAALFEEGSYAEFSFSGVSASVSGSGAALLGGGLSGDLTPNYYQFGAAYKADINDTWSYAIILSQPFGADVAYPAGTGYFAAGSTAVLDTHEIAGILQYNLPSNLSFYGGLRLQTLEATAAVPFVSTYSVTGDRDFGVGYLLGVAFERPDIALRVSLTYNSKIKHELDTVESSTALGAGRTSTTNIDTPQSVNLEFQSGVAKDTLVFGSVRWVDWTATDITPADYFTLTGGGSLVGYVDDRVTYSLGIGRRLNETWSIAASVSHERQLGGFASNLGPTDGMTSIGVGATYTKDKMKITGGIRYVMIGDAVTTLNGTTTAGTFTNNSAIGAGIRIGYYF